MVVTLRTVRMRPNIFFIKSQNKIFTTSFLFLLHKMIHLYYFNQHFSCQTRLHTYPSTLQHILALSLIQIQSAYVFCCLFYCIYTRVPRGCLQFRYILYTHPKTPKTHISVLFSQLKLELELEFYFNSYFRQYVVLLRAYCGSIDNTTIDRNPSRTSIKFVHAKLMPS